MENLCRGEDLHLVNVLASPSPSNPEQYVFVGTRGMQQISFHLKTFDRLQWLQRTNVRMLKGQVTEDERQTATYEGSALCLYLINTANRHETTFMIREKEVLKKG